MAGRRFARSPERQVSTRFRITFHRVFLPSTFTHTYTSFQNRISRPKWLENIYSSNNLQCCVCCSSNLQAALQIYNVALSSTFSFSFSHGHIGLKFKYPENSLRLIISKEY